MATARCDQPASFPQITQAASTLASRRVLALTLVALQAADLVSTLLVIRQPGIAELNPFLQGGPGYIAAAKALSALIAVWLISTTKRLRLCWLLVALFGCIVLNNLLLLLGNR
jgi:uncharacterized protein DUF5658